MGKETNKLAAEIKRFCRKHHMSVSSFGRLSSNNSALYYRLSEKGAIPSIETAARLRYWMQTYKERGNHDD